MDALLYMKLIHQKFGCLVNQVILIIRQIIEIGLNCNPRSFFIDQIDPVINTYRLHDHADLMIPVIPPSQDI